MGLLDRAFASVYDRVLAASEVRGLADQRAELLADLDGTVVEIGAGTGLNLTHYPATVDRLVLCEPAPEMRAHLEERRRDLAPAPAEVEVSEAGAELLPFPDGSVDHVVSTLVLCTVTDLDRTITELARVVRPGGTVRLLEHVVAPEERTGLRRAQRVVEPAWKVLARGCHLTREPRARLADAGFDVSAVGDDRMPGSVGLLERTVRGVAVRTP